MFPIRDHNPSLRTPYVTYALIAANVLVHLAVLGLAGTDRQLMLLYVDYGMIPARLSQELALQTLVTSTFLHAGFLHLGGNMLFLWIFGDNLEDPAGHAGFAAFYLACGAGAGAVQWLAAPWSPVVTIGASGAVAGVMGGYLLLYPKARVDILLFLVVFIRIFPVPAWIVLGIWFGLQLFSGLGDDGSRGGVAYWAHVGGFFVGLALIAPVWWRSGGIASWDRMDGHPPHPPATYGPSRVPAVTRRK